jgi:hypothetical protein
VGAWLNPPRYSPPPARELTATELLCRCHHLSSPQWPELLERYDRYHAYRGQTQREGTVFIALGWAVRRGAWGMDRVYVVSFLSQRAPQTPLAEFLAADDYAETGELIGDAWRSGPVMADDEPHSEVEYALSQHDAADHAELLHSTSWPVDGPRLVLTYIAVMHIPALARDAWPDAQLVSLDLANAVGKPLPYTPTEPPTPRYIDVLFHALRHLRFLLDNDATSAAALDQHWKRYLAELRPSLATMYDQNHAPDLARRLPN